MKKRQAEYRMNFFRCLRQGGSVEIDWQSSKTTRYDEFSKKSGRHIYDWVRPFEGVGSLKWIE